MATATEEPSLSSGSEASSAWEGSCRALTETTTGGWPDSERVWHGSPRFWLGSVIGAGDLGGVERDCDLTAGVGVRLVVVHRPQGRRHIVFGCVLTGVLGAEGHQRRPTAGAVFGSVVTDTGEGMRHEQGFAACVVAVVVAGQWRGHLADEQPAAAINVLVVEALFLAEMSIEGRRYRLCDQMVDLRLVLVSAHHTDALGRQCACDFFFLGGDESSVALEIGAESTTSCSTRCKSAGNFLPRFSARWRIPEQAFALKQYGNRWSPVFSNMSDNEHTPSSLGDGTRVWFHSDVLSVKDSPGDTIPQFL